MSATTFDDVRLKNCALLHAAKLVCMLTKSTAVKAVFVVGEAGQDLSGHTCICSGHVSAMGQ